MPHILNHVSSRLANSTYSAAGGTADKQGLQNLFDVKHRHTAAPAPRTLSPRHCEEHLVAALTAAGNAIQERQFFFTAGEKFASLVIALVSDDVAIKLLTAEAAAMDLRRQTAAAATQSEQATQTALSTHQAALQELAANLDPRGKWGKGDAQRQFWITYAARGVTSGAATLNQGWWAPSNARTDEQPTPHDGQLTLQISQPVVDMEATLASRAASATFRIAHERALADTKAANAPVAASQGRVKTLALAESFETAAHALANDRAAAAVDLRKQRQDLAQELELFGFEQQMKLHKGRAQDLSAEAVERANAAAAGLSDVYGLTLPLVPKADIETIEELLEWCRSAARTLLGFDAAVAKQRVTASLNDLLGSQWKNTIANGLELDLSWLAKIGFVVRVRDVRARFVGRRQASVVIEISLPSSANDHDTAGQHKVVKQAPVAVSLIAQALTDERSDASVARITHNYAPAGKWRITCRQLPKDVDDLLVDVDVSYLAM